MSQLDTIRRLLPAMLHLRQITGTVPIVGMRIKLQCARVEQVIAVIANPQRPSRLLPVMEKETPLFTEQPLQKSQIGLVILHAVLTGPKWPTQRKQCTGQPMLLQQTLDYLPHIGLLVDAALAT